MSAEVPFSWIDSIGWIVLSGAPDALSEIRAQALSRYDAAGAIAYISLAADLGDALMDDMAELGAPTGYLVDLEVPDNNETYEQLSEAGMIVIEAAHKQEQLPRLMTQTAKSALKSALERGALILFEGAAAAIAGEHRLTAKGELRAGLNFVHNVLIPSCGDSVAVADIARAVFQALPAVPILGLAPGSALALGPEQRIETWGDGEVTISLADPASQYDRYGAMK